MKKTLIHITVASILSWVLILAFNVIIIAAIKEVASPLVRNIIGSILYAASFVISLLYITKIRKGIGEDEFFDDYTDKKYVSIKEDIKLIIQHEKMYFLTIAIVILSCLAINIIYCTVLGNSKVFILTMIYLALNAFSTLFSLSSTGIVLNIVFSIIGIGIYVALYVFAVALYRRNIYKKAKKGNL